MSTFAAKVAGVMPRGGGAQPHHQQAGASQQRNGGPAPVRQTVGFSVPNNVDRLGFIGNVLIGYKVEVQVTSGLVYEAVFASLHSDSTGVCIVLKYAKVLRDPNSATSNRTALAEKPLPILTIPAADLVQLYAKDVRLSPEDLSGADRSDVGFETDAAISRGRGGGVRELQRWQPDEGDDAAFFSLESAGGGAGWDQFAVNRDRFGVQTTWNEHFYTTKIKRDECRITDAEAERIAREIESGITTGPTTNIHLLEERGGELAPDVDEEALYGAVIREPPSGPTPPGFHHPQHHPSQHQQQRLQQRSKAPQPSAADRSVAWGRAGSGVAAVAGGLTAAQQQHQQQHLPQQQQILPLQPVHAGPPGAAPAAKSTVISVPVPGASSSASSQGGAAATADGGGSGASSTAGGSTAPIDIDPRKEVNKVRSSLTVGPKKDRSSPFGTPKLGMSRSPVYQSPLVTDPQTLTALDLDPGAPQRLDPESAAEFRRFKEELHKKRSGQLGAEATLADLKKGVPATSLKERAPAVQPSAGNGIAAAAAPSIADSAAAPAPAASTAAAPATTAADGPTPAVVSVPAAAAASAVAVATAAAPAAPVPANGEETKPKVVSKLNPNAKPFSLNINAKEFVPSFAMAKPAAAASTSSAAAAAPTVTAAAPPAAVAVAAAAPAPPPTTSSTAAPVAAGITAAALASGGVALAPAAAVPAAVPTLSGSASTAAAAPPAVAAAAAAATALASGQASYLSGASTSHGLAVTYHHSSMGHSHSTQQGQYGGSGAGGLHGGHGHGPHHERGGGGFGGAGTSGGPMGRDMRDHGSGPVYHRGGDSYRGGDGPSSGYRGGGGGGPGGDPFRSGSASGDGYHHHHHHHKAGGGGDHHQLKGPGDGGHGGPASAGLHKGPPPPPQGPMATAEGHMTPMIMNGVPTAAMAPHGIVPMTPAMAAGMPTMGAVPYGVVMAPPGGYMTSAMPPGAVAMASTANGPVHLMAYAVRSATGGPTMAMAAAPSMAMMSAPGMATPYGAAVGPYMTAPPGAMPPPSPSGRPPSTGFFQPAGSYPMIATAHPGGHHAHPGGPMGGQPGGPMGGHHMMQGHAHGHGHMGSHMQDGRGGPGGMGGPKGGGRQGGGHRPPRMDHDRSGPRDMD